MFQQTKLPRWKGFNLMGMFTSKSPGHFEEEDFQMMADWGFNFVRLPLTYRLWIDDEDEYKINESKLEPLDEAVRATASMENSRSVSASGQIPKPWTALSITGQRWRSDTRERSFPTSAIIS